MPSPVRLPSIMPDCSWLPMLEWELCVLSVTAPTSIADCSDVRSMGRGIWAAFLSPVTAQHCPVKDMLA